MYPCALAYLKNKTELSYSIVIRELQKQAAFLKLNFNTAVMIIIKFIMFLNL